MRSIRFPQRYNCHDKYHDAQFHALLKTDAADGCKDQAAETDLPVFTLQTVITTGNPVFGFGMTVCEHRNNEMFHRTEIKTLTSGHGNCRTAESNRVF